MSSNGACIYHEQQESLLCGQHCVNNLLQAPIFTSVDLSDIAQQLDQVEQSLGVHSYQESCNVDDTGNFSIQVLASALKQYGNIVLSALKSSDDVLREQALIVNRSRHWVAYRKINGRWWDLNSALDRPEYIADSSLVEIMRDVRGRGGSVFAARGDIPLKNKDSPDLPQSFAGVWHSESRLCPGLHTNAPTNSFQAFQGKGQRLDGRSMDTAALVKSTESYDEDLAMAMALSASLNSESVSANNTKDDLTSTQTGAPVSKQDDARAKRLAALASRGLS